MTRHRDMLVLACATLCWAFLSSAMAQDASRPTEDERRIITLCLDDAVRIGARAETCIDKVSTPCMELEGGGSTQGMNACMYRENAIWDEILNTEYKALRRSLAKSTFDALRKVQRQWIAYRDAKCAYPYEAIDGTIANNFASSCINTMTARRAIELRAWSQWERGQ